MSGDFYWVTPLYDGRIAVAVADCTGHGVPGAFMSMLGITLLKELTSLHKKENAGDILFKLRQLVIASLNQTGKEGDSHDGMDMSLTIIEKDRNEIEYAGAYLPMLVVRKTEIGGFNDDVPAENQDGYSLYEYKGNKMPIGFHVIGEKPFTTHRIKYHPNGVFYMFSDGYTDQFGGPKRRKYHTQELRRKLLTYQHRTMHNQKEILLKEFYRWKGDNEQIDDVTILGIRIPKNHSL